MTDEWNGFAAPPVAPTGTWPAICTGIKPVTIDVQGESRDLVEWAFTVTDKKGNDFEVTTLSSRLFTPKSKARRWAAAMGVTGETVAPDELIGKPALLVIGEDDQGYAGKVLDVVAPLA